MEKITYPDATTTEFSYNGAGKRVKKLEGSSTVKYLYDLDKIVIETDGNDVTQATYTHEGGDLYEDLISMSRGGMISYFHFDGLGSARNLTDVNQNITDSYGYEAFGNMTSTSGTTSNVYKYVGAYGVQRDEKPDLYFRQARYYAGDIGRFISRDPVAGFLQDPQSLHTYLYAHANPSNMTDASGYGRWWNPFSWHWRWPPWKEAEQEWMKAMEKYSKIGIRQVVRALAQGDWGELDKWIGKVYSLLSGEMCASIMEACGEFAIYASGEPADFASSCHWCCCAIAHAIGHLSPYYFCFGICEQVFYIYYGYYYRYYPRYYRH